MLEQLRNLDQQLFFFVNRDMANIVFDTLCPIFRDKVTWFPIYGLLAVYFLTQYRKKGWWLILLGVITIVLSDQLSSSLIKPLVHRIRPCNSPDIKHLVRLVIDECGVGFSFVSSHATNHFALATFLTFITYQRKWMIPLWYLWAVVVGFSQVYVGVHYPGDIVCGGLLGITIGLVTGIIAAKIIKQHKIV